MLATPLAQADASRQPPGLWAFTYSGVKMPRTKFSFVMNRIQARCARKIIQLGGDTSSASKMRICLNAVSSKYRLGIVAHERAAYREASMW
jgi:hypothetical protein